MQGAGPALEFRIVELASSKALWRRSMRLGPRFQGETSWFWELRQVFESKSAPFTIRVIPTSGRCIRVYDLEQGLSVAQHHDVNFDGNCQMPHGAMQNY